MNDSNKIIKSDIELRSLDSVENNSYSVTANLKVDDYYKKTDLRGIEIRDVKKIKDIADNTKVWMGVVKEIMLALATTLLGIAIGKLFTGISWESSADVIYFFIALLLAIIFAAAYIVLCTIKCSDDNKLIDTLRDHLFIPLGLEEAKNEK